MRISKEFAGTSGAIAAARLLTNSFLRGAGTGGAAVREDTVERAVLVVSELVTNAVRHTDGPCGVELRIDGRAVEISVWDTSSDAPVAMGPDPTRIGRHGMEIVAVLCGGYTVTPRRPGKHVSARLPLDAAGA
ncbi:Histidine kinase-like ATPase domain-containing protein [Actinacidiphila alni]|uniref:Histidine kinase-like ATPase domain-containing protein n=1 Tax=Actinacidiphila alni TaxID=380248 RepID=A0A1I2LIM4_9ACTN|nr:ATP-binding protein [Actinacidiphila alni]SFF77307.1 Histidine kinase-like ATPase domain-containing protein [Actinacidiphila alni]